MSYTNIDNNGPRILNSTKNIISGPFPGDYWSHSGDLEKPDYREEGPFPIQGSIGSLLKQESNKNYSNCYTNNNIAVSGSPNCTGVFTKDIYTTENTCGSNCVVKAPEIFGMQSFGMLEDKFTNIHGLHAYKNIRAAAEGQGPADSYGCYEWTPSLKQTADNTCEIDYSVFENSTVGDFTKLSNWKSLTR